MKKTISVFMTLIILLLPTISLANNIIVSGGDHLGIEFDIVDIEGAKKMSFEEVVEKRMVSENISYNESLEKMLEEEEEILQDFAEKLYESNYSESRLLVDNEQIINEIKDNIDIRSIINYVSVEQDFTYSRNTNYKARLEAELRIVQDTSTSYLIDRVMGLTSRRIAGSYNYTWNETASDYDLAVGRKSVYMWVKGYFEVQRDVGIGGGPSIPGFSFEVNIGGTEYFYSDTIRGTKTYSVR